MWKVHYPEYTKKMIWICETDRGSWCILHREPPAESKTKWYAAVATMEDGFAIREIRWSGEKPEWSDKHVADITKPDMRPLLPNWAYSGTVKWRSTGADLRIKRERAIRDAELAQAKAVSQRTHDYFGDTGDGNVTRYTRQAGSPENGYLADDGTRWKDYIPNGSARYGNLGSSSNARHRYPYMWEIRGAGRPEVVDAWIFKANGHPPGISFVAPTSTTTATFYHAKITKIGRYYRSVNFTEGEPWTGASAEIVRLYGTPLEF
jgi:hypothetical protein